MRALALQIRACALCRLLLVCFDGFSDYVDAFAKAFRSPLHTQGKRITIGGRAAASLDK